MTAAGGTLRPELHWSLRAPRRSRHHRLAQPAATPAATPAPSSEQPAVQPVARAGGNRASDCNLICDRGSTRRRASEHARIHSRTLRLNRGITTAAAQTRARD